MEGSPKCDLCVFIAKAMERCVLRHYKNFIVEYIAFTSEPSSLRVDRGSTFNWKQAYCQSNFHFMLLFLISMLFRISKSLTLGIFIYSPGEVLGKVTSCGLKHFQIFHSATTLPLLIFSSLCY